MHASQADGNLLGDGRVLAQEVSRGKPIDPSTWQILATEMGVLSHISHDVCELHGNP